MKKSNKINVLNENELNQVSGGAKLYASLNRTGMIAFQGANSLAIDTVDLSDGDCSIVSHGYFCKEAG